MAAQIYASEYSFSILKIEYEKKCITFSDTSRQDLRVSFYTLLATVDRSIASNGERLFTVNDVYNGALDGFYIAPGVCLTRSYDRETNTTNTFIYTDGNDGLYAKVQLPYQWVYCICAWLNARASELKEQEALKAAAAKPRRSERLAARTSRV